MSKQNYTPGPWAFDSAHDQVIVESGFGNVAIAETYGEDWEANARLIAAAPEMLEALQLVVERLSTYVHKMNVKNNFHEKVAMEAARTAIMKAIAE